nr:GNAT family N-acetyltransferase [Rhodococcus sp. WY5]
MFTLTTERLVLRDFTAADEGAVHQYASDPAVCRYVDWGPNTPAVTRAFLADAALEAALVERRTFTLAITSKADGTVIGSVAVWEVSAAHRRAELGFVVNPKFQGRGYASEAGRAVLGLAFARLRSPGSTASAGNVSSGEFGVGVGAHQNRNGGGGANEGTHGDPGDRGGFAAFCCNTTRRRTARDHVISLRVTFPGPGAILEPCSRMPCSSTRPAGPLCSITRPFLGTGTASRSGPTTSTCRIRSRRSEVG